MPNQFDMSGEVMQIMRMMEFLRQHKLEQERQQAGVGRLAEDPRLQEIVENTPVDQREEVIRQIMQARNVPQSQYGMGRRLLMQPSQRYQSDVEKFMLDAEDVKADLASSRNRSRMLRPILSKYMSPEELDSIMIPMEQEDHDRAQAMVSRISRMGLHAFRARPNDPQYSQVIKELEAVAAMGPGAGDSYGQRRSPTSPFGGGPQRPSVLPGPYRAQTLESVLNGGNGSGGMARVPGPGPADDRDQFQIDSGM